jgi:hypothetical protein
MYIYMCIYICMYCCIQLLELIGNTCCIYIRFLFNKHAWNPIFGSGSKVLLSPAWTGRSRVISCHLRDIGGYLVMVGYNCYYGK